MPTRTNQVANKDSTELKPNQKLTRALEDDYQKYLDGENSKIDYKSKKAGIFSRILFLYLNKIVALGAKARYELSMLFKVPEVLQHENRFPKFKEYYDKKFEENPGISFFKILLGYQFWMWLEGSLRYFVPFFFQLFLPVAIKICLNWLTGEEGEEEDWRGLLAALALMIISLSKSIGTSQAIESAQLNAITTEMLIRVS